MWTERGSREGREGTWVRGWTTEEWQREGGVLAAYYSRCRTDPLSLSLPFPFTFTIDTRCNIRPRTRPQESIKLASLSDCQAASASLLLRLRLRPCLRRAAFYLTGLAAARMWRVRAAMHARPTLVSAAALSSALSRQIKGYCVWHQTGRGRWLARRKSLQSSASGRCRAQVESRPRVSCLMSVIVRH